MNQVLDESGWTLQSQVLSSSTFKALRTVVNIEQDFLIHQTD